MTKGRAKSFADSSKERLIGFSGMAKKLSCSESPLSRIFLEKFSGKYGLPMATIAHVGVAMDLKPHTISKNTKNVVC